MNSPNTLRGITRREMFKRTAAAIPLVAAAPFAFAAEASSSRKLGIGMHSYGFAWKAAKDGNAGVKFTGVMTFLEYARRIGAAGVQVVIRPDERDEAPRIRARGEQLEMFFEGQLSLPKDDADLARFETEVKTIRAAGSTVARTAVLGTRRYESLHSPAEFRAFKERGERSLTLAEPVLKKHGVRLAIENHKDYLTSELVEMLRKFNSEWIGVCVDLGNSIALLEDPYAVVEALAPFAVTTHIKDMAVQECAECFLLSEVPPGEGFLDLPRMIATLRKVHPRIALNIEMITRDPLSVPCLTPEYWATFGEMKAAQLAEALARVKENASRNPLPRISGLSAAEQLQLEDKNVRRYLVWAREKLN